MSDLDSIQEEPRLLFICPMMTHPRFIKRVEAALAQGFEVTIVSYEREYYTENRFPPNVTLISLGKISNRKYLRRSLKMVMASRRIKRVVRDWDPHAIYSFGDDNLMLAVWNRKKHCTIVHELGDLRTTKGKLPAPLFRLLSLQNKYLYSHIDYLVLTSAAFVEHLPYVRPTTQVVILENKLSEDLVRRANRAPTIGNSGVIQIGLIGFLRYRTIFTLFDVVSENPDRFFLNVWGDGPLAPETEQIAEKFPNIEFHGSFKYPDDIPKLYSKTDISFVVYDNNDLNVRLALPNKLYESAFYGVPMLVANDTELCRKSTSLGVGHGVDPYDSESLTRKLMEFTRADLADMQLQILDNIKSAELLEEGPRFFSELKSSLITQ